MIGYEELLEIEEVISEKLFEILIKLNRSEKLEEFLNLIGLSELLGKDNPLNNNPNGKILVIGKCEVKEETLAAIARELGINKNRFEFHLNYMDGKSFNFKKTQWSNEYSVILAGQMPHSGNVKGDHSSIISAIESEEGYPPIVRVGMTGLKITKSSFRNTLESLIEEKRIA